VSEYIVVADSALTDTVLPEGLAIVPGTSNAIVFAGGSDGSEISSTELVSGWDEFSNPDNIDIRILINGGETDLSVQTKMKSVAEERLDCIAVLDVPYASTNSVTDMLTFRNTTQNFNSSYCALYSPWPKVYDAYNDLLLTVPPSGLVAGQFAYNDYVGNPWSAPAGFNRGGLDVIEIVKLDGKPFTQGDRDVLYPAQINCLQMFRGEGNAIWGQRTEQAKDSALSRVNVRRLLIVIEKTLAISLRQFAFEPNNEITRFRIESLIKEYLDKLSSQGAFQLEGNDRGYHVVCDESNNTPAVIDDFALNVDVFVKPVRSAEFIRLQIIPTKTGASFKELIAKGVIF
jgi:phage tail sheath protein FI